MHRSDCSAMCLRANTRFVRCWLPISGCCEISRVGAKKTLARKQSFIGPLLERWSAPSGIFRSTTSKNYRRRLAWMDGLFSNLGEGVGETEFVEFVSDGSEERASMVG